MKKKLMIIGAMIFVCTGLFLLAQKGQNSYINNKSTTIPVESKATEIAVKDEVQPAAKVGSVSEQGKTNTAVAKEPSTVATTEVKPNSTESKVVNKAGGSAKGRTNTSTSSGNTSSAGTC